MKKYKGQTFSFELLIIIPLLFLLFLIFVSTYENLKSEKNDMFMRGIVILDSLIESPGHPENWDYENVKRLGLCNKRGKIDRNKLEEFVKIDEIKLNEIAISGEHNLFINLKYLNGTLFDISGNETKIGVPLPEHGTSNVLYLREYAVYENEILILEVVLWN